MKTHDYIHRYKGYWSDGGKCRIRIYREEGRDPVVICSQLPEKDNTSVTNMAEYLAAEVIEEHGLATPLTWIEHYPEHRGRPGEYSLGSFSSWERREVRLGGVWRYRVGSPNWSPSWPEKVEELIKQQVTAVSFPPRSC
jgi:protoheme ferro-lyase